jgi:hypothetical protein
LLSIEFDVVLLWNRIDAGVVILFAVELAIISAVELVKPKNVLLPEKKCVEFAEVLTVLLPRFIALFVKSDPAVAPITPNATAVELITELIVALELNINDTLL